MIVNCTSQHLLVYYFLFTFLVLCRLARCVWPAADHLSPSYSGTFHTATHSCSVRALIISESFDVLTHAFILLTHL